jgi:phosphate/sulfate permease
MMNEIMYSYFHRNIVGAWLVTLPIAGAISAAAIAILREIAL